MINLAELINALPLPKELKLNEKGNVYLLDCGSGFKGGRLACMCLETGQRFYSSCE